VPGQQPLDKKKQLAAILSPGRKREQYRKMATIIPFKGLRYNKEMVGNMADVVTPPYDVIDDSAQELYYARHPYNIIRLEYGKNTDGGNTVNNRYTRAAADFKDWIVKRILVPENQNAIYLYEQEFSLDSRQKIRSGFICAIKLEPYEKGIILPHEETLPKHKADRLELMRACKANFSPIFGLYSDPSMKIMEILRASTGEKQPAVSFTVENGESHRLWVITDPAAIVQIQQSMAGKQILIADGHHRYETALNYMKEQDNNENVHSPANFVMVTLVNLFDPGLNILPTHRLVKNIGSRKISSLLNRLRELFVLDEFPLEPDKHNLNRFLSEMSSRSLDKKKCAGSLHNHVFGTYLNNGKLFFTTLKDKEVLSLMPENKSANWHSLDVSVLHSLILDNCLGIGSELVAGGNNITYTRDAQEALLSVDRGEHQAAFLLNPTLVEEVTGIAGIGEKMPQKSTYFFPKLITGLVIRSLS